MSGLVYNISMRSKTKILLSLIILSSVVVIGSFFMLRRPGPAETTNDAPPHINKVDYSPPTKEQVEAATPSKEAIGNRTKINSPSSQSQTGRIEITRAGQVAYKDMVSVRAMIYGYKSGSCNATFLSSGSPSIIKSVPIVLTNNYYSCAPIDIPVSNFSSAGTWEVRLTATDTDNSTVSNIDQATFEVTK